MKKSLFGILAVLSVMSCSFSEEKGYVGKPEVQVTDGVLSPEVLLSLGRVSDPQLSPDGSTVLYGVSYISIEENKSCRNLYVCDTDGGSRKQLTKFAKSVSNARWSADGKSIYFIQDGQIWRTPYSNGRLESKEKMTAIKAGVSAFELGPDNQILIVSSVPGPVTGPASRYEDLDKAQAYVATDLMYRHWDHWVTETPRTYLAHLGRGAIGDDALVDLLAGEEGYELPTEPFGGMEQISWAPGGRHIAYSCRKKTGKEYAFSTDTDIYVYDITTGQTIAVTHGGGYDTNPKWSPDGTRLAWLSMERDGYEADRNRILMVDVKALPAETDGQNFGIELSEPVELTAGYEYDADEFVWTSDSRRVIFSSIVDAVSRLCKITVKHCGKHHHAPGYVVEDFIVDDQAGLSAPFAIFGTEDEYTVLCCAQSMLFPTELARYEIAGDGNIGKSFITTENSDILSQLSDVRIEKEMLKCQNGEDMLCWVLYPAGFDSTGTYPAIEMFNGGPQTPLDQSWSYRWNFRMMCQQGYVVILPNRHGNTGLGQAWKEQISGDYQGLNMQDYITAGRWIKSQPWCGKLAGVGASYGGFSVYNMMGIHGDLFDCFISHAGIFNERQMWYTTEEAWFGNWDNGGLMTYAYTPGQTGPAGDGVTFGGLQQAGAPYADVAKSKFHYANDPETKVTKWHTPILCMHGMMDFRIPYEQGMAAFNAAQMMGVPSKLVIFPEECHWILQPQNALFWHREFFDWLDRWTK